MFWPFSQILSTLRDSLQDVPKQGPLTKIAHLGSTWSVIHGTVGLTMDLPCNMAVYAPSLSIFLLSQFPTAPLEKSDAQRNLLDIPSRSRRDSRTSA
jgi:hypothetical protein